MTQGLCVCTLHVSMKKRRIFILDETLQLKISCYQCVSSACALRVTSEYSFTDLGRMDS